MIGSSSARVKERLTDGDVIVVEVIRELLLAKGLLGVFDITCGGVVLGQGAKVLCGVAQGVIHVITEVEDVGQQEQQGNKRDEEEGDEVKGEVEEI